MKISPQDMYDLVVYQAGAVEAFARAAGAKLHHVKCHGSLYNMAATDEGLSEAMAKAVGDLGSGVMLYPEVKPWKQQEKPVSALSAKCSQTAAIRTTARLRRATSRAA